jgi:hypothetical protein
MCYRRLRYLVLTTMLVIASSLNTTSDHYKYSKGDAQGAWLQLNSVTSYNVIDNIR